MKYEKLNIFKVGYVFLVIILSELRMGQYRNTMTIGKMHPTLPARFVNIIFSVIKNIAQKLVDPCFYFFVTVFDLKGS